MIGGSAQWFNLWTGTPQEEIVVDPRRRYYFYRQSWNTPGGISLITLDVNGGAYAYPDAFGADNTNLTTLQCSGQVAPIHIQLTPDEDITRLFLAKFMGNKVSRNQQHIVFNRRPALIQGDVVHQQRVEYSPVLCQPRKQHDQACYYFKRVGAIQAMT